MKTRARILIEQIQAITKDSILSIHTQAMDYVADGMFYSREAALEFILTMLQEEQ